MRGSKAKQLRNEAGVTSGNITQYNYNKHEKFLGVTPLGEPVVSTTYVATMLDGQPRKVYKQMKKQA